MMNALNYVAHGGKLIFVGLFIGDFSFHDPDFHKRETTLLGSRNSCPEDMIHVIQLLESGEIDTNPWITHRVPRDSMIDSFPEWLEPDAGVIKTVVDWS